MTIRSDQSSVLSKYLGWLLAILFLFALVMGAGPGMLLANEPKMWLGLPRLYVWGTCWCGVEMAIVVVAYFTVWREDKADDE